MTTARRTGGRGVKGERSRRARKPQLVAVRAPHLYRSLRCFCLAGFSLLAADVGAGEEIPFAFEEHAGGGRGRAALYEYRPLVRSYVDARAERLGGLAAHWPEASGLLPAGFGREADRLCLLELERTLAPDAASVPDAPGELADAVSALRLAAAAPIAAGPVLFERLDWRPLGIRPVLPIAATEPSGEPTRLHALRPP